MRYANRAAAGRALAACLTHLADAAGAVVLGLPRGGIPVAAEVSAALRLPLDVLVVRKLGVPGHRELAMGAVGPGGIRVLQEGIIRRAGITARETDDVAARETAELERQEGLYRPAMAPLDLAGKSAILVDDGLATGASMLAAIRGARALGAHTVIVAAPVGATDTIGRLQDEADEVVVDQAPAHFGSVGQWYDDFDQVSDTAVLSALGHRPRRLPD